MTVAAVADPRDLEIARLRQGLGDLVGLLALSAAWTGREAPEVLRMLGEALFSVLDLDLVYVVLEDDAQSAFARDRAGDADHVAASAEWRRLLGPEPHKWPSGAVRQLFGKQVSISALPLGLRGGHGVIAVASQREGFPSDTEKLLLNVARNQALLALQEARLRRDERLRASELSALEVIEGIPGFVAVLAPDGGVERVNRQIEDYCGVPLEELRNWGTNGIVHPEDMPHVAEIFGASIATGTPYVIEQRLRRFDGEYRWFDNRGRPLRDASDRIVAWHVLLTDIDDRRRAEEAVRASETNLRQQSETFPQMLWSATADGDIDYCNERLLAYSGLTAADVMDGGWVNLLHPDDREPTAAVWMRCVATGEPYSVEVRHYNLAAGEHRWNLTTALPLRDADGRIVKWYGACVDIHELKLTGEALGASERHLAQLIDTIPAYVFSAGPDGSVNYLNPQMREWFGRAEETIMAAEWVHLTHPDDRDGTVEAWFGAVAAGEPYRREVRFLHHSGEYRWCDNLARPLRDPDGQIVAWHGVVNDVHDRKLAEEALRASEANLRLTIDTIPALAWSARADGTADFFNRHYLDYVGQSAEQLYDWQWVGAVHPDDAGTLADVWQVCREHGTGAEVEARLRRHDGEYRWFLFQASPLRDDNGEVVKWYGVNTDIEDRKRAEQELAARERTLREAHDHLAQAQRLSHTGSFRTDVVADTHVQSDELHRILECAPATLGEFRDRIHPDDIAAFDAGFRKAMIDKTDFDAVFRFVTPAGDTKYLHAVSHFQPGNDDRPIVMGSIQDITEARHAEEELRRSAYLLAAAERISETGSYHWDLTANRLVWSAGMYRIHEMDESIEPRYPDLLSSVHPDDVDLVGGRVRTSFSGDGRDPVQGYRIVMPDGRIKYLKTAYQVITRGDGSIESVGVAQDVTQQRLAEAAVDKLRSELAHVTRVSSLGELAASIAHEVNQPLSGILTNASTCLRMLGLDEPDVEGAIRTAQRSIRDANRASEVIKRLRGLYRRQDFTPESFDLNEAAHEVVSICEHDLQRRGIALKLELAEALPLVTGDRIQLQQVILNLVLNAADALAAINKNARRIFIESAEAPPGTVQFTVRDTGPGISAQDRASIFDAFFTTKPNGMGIGLSVSKTIIDRHGGNLWIDSAHGPGAAFAFSIPCAPNRVELEASSSGSDGK